MILSLSQHYIKKGSLFVFQKIVKNDFSCFDQKILFVVSSVVLHVETTKRFGFYSWSGLGYILLQSWPRPHHLKEVRICIRAGIEFWKKKWVKKKNYKKNKKDFFSCCSFLFFFLTCWLLQKVTAMLSVWTVKVVGYEF